MSSRASTVVYPAVARWGDIDRESFDSYYARWPPELRTIPRSVAEDWIHRHWRDFHEYWEPLQPHRWRFSLQRFSNERILSVDHVLEWIPELDAEGVEYVNGAERSRAGFAQFMLAQGTFPVPILVAENAGHIVHPRGFGEKMKQPFQLIEGHCRLACIRGMIQSRHKRLQEQHEVWVAELRE
jgi:hypothetical protein